MFLKGKNRKLFRKAINTKHLPVKAEAVIVPAVPEITESKKRKRVKENNIEENTEKYEHQ